MTRFRIEVPIRGSETYYVEANTKEQALELIKSGDIEYAEQDIQDTHYEVAEILEEE